MDDDRVLIIDDDAETAAFLHKAFAEAGVATDSVKDAFAAMEKLRERAYSSVVLDPMIRHCLNAYAVLNFIELEQPDALERLFLLAGMSGQTVARLFRKPSPEAGSKGSVLLVEDDGVTANATRGVLEELGHAVEWARNGRDALEALAARRFDVILLDLVMPHDDGFLLLKQFHPERSGILRRVIVSTEVPDKYFQALDRSAIGGLVQKPVDVRILQQALLDCVNREEVPFEPGGEVPEEEQ